MALWQKEISLGLLEELMVIKLKHYPHFGVIGAAGSFQTQLVKPDGRS